MDKNTIDLKSFQKFMFFIEKYKVLSCNQIIIRELSNLVRNRKIDSMEKYLEDNKEELKKKHPEVIKELKKIDIFI